MITINQATRHGAGGEVVADAGQFGHAQQQDLEGQERQHERTPDRKVAESEALAVH